MRRSRTPCCLVWLSLAACRIDPEKEGNYTPDPPVDGKLLLNLSLAHLDEGPAYGARDQVHPE